MTINGDGDLLPYIQKFFYFTHLYDIKIKHVESFVKDEENKYCGKVDLIDEENGILLDIKLTNMIGLDYYFQTEAYRRAYNKQHNIELKSRALIRLDKNDIENSEYIVIPEERNDEDWGGFKCCLNIYYMQKGFEDEQKC